MNEKQSLIHLQLHGPLFIYVWEGSERKVTKQKNQKPRAPEGDRQTQHYYFTNTYRPEHVWPSAQSPVDLCAMPHAEALCTDGSATTEVPSAPFPCRVWGMSEEVTLTEIIRRSWARLFSVLQKNKAHSFCPCPWPQLSNKITDLNQGSIIPTSRL